jgi:hypothetical protein
MGKIEWLAKVEELLGPNPSSNSSKFRCRACGTPVRCTRPDYFWMDPSIPLKHITTHFPWRLGYMLQGQQPSPDNPTKGGGLVSLGKGKMLPQNIKEAINVHYYVMTGGDKKPQLICQALKQCPSFGKSVLSTHPECMTCYSSKKFDGLFNLSSGAKCV